jgi:curved DNA-binding protein CbpA
MADSVGDLRSLPLAPIDGFILTRVNGAASIREIAAQTGVSEDDVEGSLNKLAGLGIVQFVGEARAELPPPPPEEAVRHREPPRLTEVMASGPVTYDPAELDEPCDLEGDERFRILELYYRLDDVNYYQLLGVPRDADRKKIKRSYFELAAHFHPDKHFRKNLGAFKQKMEIIFGRVTEAHDTLTSKEKRPEYDQYLEVQEQARGIEAMMANAQADAIRAREALRRQVPISQPPPGRLTPSMAYDPRREEEEPGPRPTPTPAPAPYVPPPARAPAASQPAIGPSSPIDPREAREALARRLRGATAKPPPRTAASMAPGTATQDAMDSLKRRYEDRIADANKAQAVKYKEAGDLARASKDMVSAANAYRVAVSFDGEDPELMRLFKMTQEAADMALAENYVKQATYEERTGRWVDAARSWARVAKAKPDNASVHDKLANAILQSQGNLHEAADAAKRAIEYGSAMVAYRVTLINIYVAAGLLIAAKRELEQANRMDPGNPAVVALVKRLQKTG